VYLKTHFPTSTHLLVEQADVNALAVRQISQTLSLRSWRIKHCTGLSRVSLQGGRVSISFLERLLKRSALTRLTLLLTDYKIYTLLSIIGSIKRVHDIIIAGAGPISLTTALILHAYG
jgi:hypothetical protein